VKHRLIGITAVVTLVLALLASPVMAQEPSIHQFSGSVTLDSTACPGSIVQAKVEDMVVGTATVTPDSMYYMLVPQVDGVPVEGATLNFYVDGNFAAMHIWNAGDSTTLDLSAFTSSTDNPNVVTGFASIQDKLVTAYGYKAGEGVAGWTVYSPSWPAEVNTFTRLYKGRGYWINVIEECALTYDPYTYNLDTGWNLIGWLGGTGSS